MGFIRLFARWRYTNVIKILVIVVCFCLAINIHPAPVRADTNPEIDYAPSTVQNGQSVTINGAAFGAKPNPSPVRYDNFESGTIGTRLLDQDSGGWYTEMRGGIFPRYSTVRQRIPGEQVIEQRYRPATASNQTIGLWRLPAFRKFYASMWVYRDDFEGTAMQCINWKAWGNFGSYDPVHWYGYPQCRVDAYPINGSGHLYALNSSGQITDLPQQWFDSGAQLTSEMNRWIRIERYIDAGTINNADFTSWVSTDLNKWAEISGGPLYRDDGLMLDAFVFGQYFDVDPPSVASLNQYVSEMYCDTTQARIEIGDTPSWDTNTHREIQVPHTTWVDGQIQFTVNQGTFTDGESAYLYVVDENGVVNTTGYPITFAGATDCTPAWECSNWSTCADSIQTRSCDDHNLCGSDAGRPVETAPCDSTAPGTVTDLVAS